MTSTVLRVLFQNEAKPSSASINQKTGLLLSEDYEAILLVLREFGNDFNHTARSENMLVLASVLFETGKIDSQRLTALVASGADANFIFWDTNQKTFQLQNPKSVIDQVSLSLWRQKRIKVSAAYLEWAFSVGFDPLLITQANVKKIGPEKII